MRDVIPFPEMEKPEEEPTPQISHRDVTEYIDRVAGREDPILQEEVRRDMRKGYMKMGTTQKDRHVGREG